MSSCSFGRLALKSALFFCMLLAARRHATAIDVLWIASGSANYNSGANWSSSFVPEAGGGNNERAIIGSTQSGATLAGVATLSSTPVAAGGLVLGLEPTSTGSLAISSGVLGNVTTAQANLGADGRIFVGGGGRGYLTMTGGTLNGLALTVAGENVATGSGTSLVDLSGTATVNITGATGVTGLTNIARRLQITGPNVNFTTQRNLRLESTAQLVENITSSSAHSPLKTNAAAILGGTLSVNFSGAGATHVPGQTWNLIDAAGAITGNFSNVPAGTDVPVTGATAPVGAAYRLAKVPGPSSHTLLQLSLEKVLVLRVNRDTGELSIRNPLGGAIAIDGYEVDSSLGSLLAGYKGISGAPAADSGWTKVGMTGQVLAEVKQVGTYDLTSVGSVTLGTGFSRTAVGSNTANFGRDGEDLFFSYTTPGQDVIRGQVEYVGTKFENDLVLRVNPTTGQAFLKNDSLVALSFDGYSVLSTTGSLDGNAWSGIGGQWQKSNPPTSGALSETNPTGSTTLAPGAQIAIGDIGAFTTPAAQAGLSLQFILSTGFGNSPSDVDNDGDVDGADFLAIQRGVGTTYTATDIANWKTNYGGAGGPPETTFRTGSVVFDATAGVAVAAAVPEPAAASLALASVLGALAMRCRRGGSLVTTSLWNSQIMRRYQLLAAFVVCAVCLLLGDRAAAVTQGISLTNGRFNQPSPEGAKYLAFDDAGAPIAGAIPGWTFAGPGQELWGDDLPGDSGTEGGGNPGNEMILSTFDGVVYQTSGFSVVNVPSSQQYLLSFDAHDIFTIDANNTTFETSQAQLTARLYYDNVGTRTTIGSPLVISGVTGGFSRYTIAVRGGSALLTPALGKPIGVEFDTTSDQFNPLVAHSWVGVDNVLLQIAGTMEGDLNGDGSINLTDYSILRDNLQEAHDFLADGDITGDGFVNLNDFRAWKSLPQVIASGVLATIAVPEPATCLLLAVGVGIFGMQLRRSRRSAPCRLSRGVLLAAVSAAAVVGTTARATLLYYDPFLVGANPGSGEYTLGPLNGQNPTVGPTPFFTGAWETRAADQAPNDLVSQPGLSYLGSGASGGAVRTTLNAEMTSASSRNGRHLQTPLDSTTVGTYYFSWVSNFGSIPGGTGDMGHRAVEFWTATGSVGVDSNLSVTIGYLGYNGGLGPDQQAPATARIRAIINGNQQIIENAPPSFNQDGATHLFVMKIQMTTDPVENGAGGDTVSLFLDPTSVIEPDLPGVSVTGLDFSLGSMSSSIFFGGAVGVMPSFDELRVADSWASVVPDFPTPGDTDGDHDVDLVDYNAIISHFGQQVGTTAEGDVALASGQQGADGRVSLGDFRIWKDHRTAITSTSAAVPEPTSGCAALLASAASLWILRRRRKADGTIG